jgi:hypothetical protein
MNGEIGDNKGKEIIIWRSSRKENMEKKEI